MNIRYLSSVQEFLVPYLLRNPTTSVWIDSTPASGNTLAYAIAILNKIDCQEDVCQALCVVDSNENAIQIGTLIGRCGAYKNVKIGLALKTDQGKHIVNQNIYFNLSDVNKCN